MGQVCLDMAVHVPMNRKHDPVCGPSARLHPGVETPVCVGGGHDCLPPSPASGLAMFPVWQMQSGLVVCGGDPSFWLDLAKTLNISPTDSLHPHWEGAPLLAPKTVSIK